MCTREPYNAGRFYPGTKKEIKDLLDTILNKEKPAIDYSLTEKNIIGGVVPHAGYMFSAYQAVHFFDIAKKSSKKYDTIFIINPSHTGYGSDIALDENNYWDSPLGVVEIDSDFNNLLDIPKSEIAHQYEHSGEVMLPMLQYFFDYDFKILPITITHQTHKNALTVARNIYETNKVLKKNILIIASSDFSHQLPPDVGKKLDSLVVDQILKLNAEEVGKVVREKKISVCGYGPIMSLIEYSKLVAKNPKVNILKRGHSGEVMPSNSVVDYISILFYK